ncbi:hypothetical protein [Turicimonas muris]|uniref:hypothetical protein n=1 Tax=Turicimonas muris TaxID=1796652 RepID=UPI0025A5C9AF|nr:hypothetical protein [Turicimonas muris]
MQANEDVAKKLADLTMKAKLERAELQQEIYEIRNKPRTLANVGVAAYKTARSIGLDDMKVILPIAKTVLLPAGIALGRILAEKSSPKRVAGVAGIVVLGAFGILKGIQYDKKRRAIREEEKGYLPEVIEEPTSKK